MDRQFTGIMPDLPPGKTHRKGQLTAFEKIQQQKSVNGQLPTGYGKTWAIDGCYEVLKKLGVCNRILIIFPTSAQIDQYKRDHPKAIDISYFGIEARKKHLNGTHEVFCITVQALIQRGTYDLVVDMMNKGNWFLAIDEYHHYAEDKAWGMKAANLPYVKRICLSATPYRKEDDSAFGDPDFQISYIDAYIEGAVKDLKANEYEYELDLFDDETEEVKHINTTDFQKEFGEGEEATKLMIERRMRFSKKYIHPLVNIPIERLISHRAARPSIRNQALIFCMSVYHARMVAEQIQKLHPDLKIEWVGNGQGATRDDNGDVIEKFLNNEIDVLCNYNMAGEGIDSINVTEIIFLKNVKMGNTPKQHIGRGCRIIYDRNGKPHNDICCTVNFDTSCELANGEYYDKADFKTVMDYNGEKFIPGEPHEPRPPIDLPPLPAEPEIIITHIKLKKVYSPEDPEIQKMAMVLKGKSLLDIDACNADHKHSDWSKIINTYIGMVTILNEESEEEKVAQWNVVLNNALTSVTGRAVKIIYNGNAPESARGDIKKNINKRKASKIGNLNNRDLESLHKHYDWVRALETQLINNITEPWLRS